MSRNREKPKIPGQAPPATESLNPTLSNPPRRGNVVFHQETTSQTITYQGPFPHPDILRQFETVKSGTAERLIQMAEGEGRHRQEIEKMLLGSEIRTRENQFKLASRGQIFSVAISLTAIVGGVIVGIWGQPWLGTALGGGGLATVILSAIRKPVNTAKHGETKPADAQVERSENAPN
jgi:uncharacterized membrane protein